MPVDRLQGWIKEWIERNHRWKRIRVLGGEPTLHPEFERIVGALLRYREWSPSTVIEIVTNGHGSLVHAKINQLPSDIWIENSRKTTVIQEAFAPFNLAPIDDPIFQKTDFSNGCAIASKCGMGLTPLGYYPCALAGGIDRITGEFLGRQHLPEDTDDMLSITRKSCRLCGRFRDGHFVPHALRPQLLEEKISPTWHRLYGNWMIRQMSANDKHRHSS